MTEDNQDIIEATDETEASAFAQSLSDAISESMGKKPQSNDESVPEETAKEEDEAPKEDQKKEEQGDYQLIPKEWSRKEKEEFEKVLANPELTGAVEVLKNRYDSLKKGFYQKADEMTTYKRDVDGWNQIFNESAKEALKSRGISEHEYVKRLMNTERLLQENPADTLKKLAEYYKVEPAKEVKDEYLDYDDKLAEMQRKLDAIEKKEQDYLNQTQAAQEKQVAQEVDDFKYSLNDDGEPKYPLFEEVRDEMSIFLTNGKAKTLEEAYNMAPTVKEKLLEERSKEAEASQLEEERRRVAKAKRSSSGVTNTRVAKVDGKRLKFEQALAQRIREAGSSA